MSISEQGQKPDISQMPLRQFFALPDVKEMINARALNGLLNDPYNVERYKIVQDMFGFVYGNNKHLPISVGSTGTKQIKDALALYGIVGPNTTPTQHHQPSDETVIKLSPHGLTMTFGANVDPERRAAFQKDFAALVVKSFGPSDTTPAPAPPT